MPSRLHALLTTLVLMHASCAGTPTKGDLERQLAFLSQDLVEANAAQPPIVNRTLNFIDIAKQAMLRIACDNLDSAFEELASQPEDAVDQEHIEAAAEHAFQARRNISDYHLMHSRLLRSNHYLVHTGVAVFNPYSIQGSGESYSLDTDSATETSFYVEAYFKSRYAWDTPESMELPSSRSGFGLVLDYEARIGFVANTEEDSIVSGSSSIAANNMYFQGCVGINLNRMHEMSSLHPLYLRNYAIRSRGHLSVDAIGGFTTDNEFSDVHMSIGLGLGMSVGVPFRLTGEDGSLESEYRLAEGIVGVYPLYYSDYPNFNDDSGLGVMSVRGEPDFESRPGLMVRVGVNCPLSRDIDIVLSASATVPYDTDNNLPPPWSVFLGMSIPLRKIF